MGWTSSKEDSFAVLDAFVEAGGNFVPRAIQAAWLRRGSVNGWRTEISLVTN
jgi:hypothetical protein